MAGKRINSQTKPRMAMTVAESVELTHTTSCTKFWPRAMTALRIRYGPLKIARARELRMPMVRAAAC